LAVLAGYQLSGDDAIDAARVFQATLDGFISLKQAGGFGLPVDVDRSFDHLIAGLAGTLGAWTVDQIGTMTTVRAATSHSHPAVTGKPLLWLRAEGPIELFAAMLLFHTTHQSWWLGPKIGAALYNAGHSQTAPILLALAALEWHHPLLLTLALLWLAHIGLDRAFAYGLKQERRVASPTALLGTGTAFAMPIPIDLRSRILDIAQRVQVAPAGGWMNGWPP